MNHLKVTTLQAVGLEKITPKKNTPESQSDSTRTPNNRNASKNPAYPIRPTNAESGQTFAIFNPRAAILSSDSSATSSASSASVVTIPAACNALDRTKRREVILNFHMRDVKRFFRKGQERQTREFTLSNGEAGLKFFFKIKVRTTNRTKKYLAISACLCSCAFCNALQTDAEVYVSVSLMSQKAGQEDKVRKEYFNFGANKEKHFPFFISYADLKESAFLQGDHLHLQLSCRLDSINKVSLNMLSFKWPVLTLD